MYIFIVVYGQHTNLSPNVSHHQYDTDCGHRTDRVGRWCVCVCRRRSLACSLTNHASVHYGAHNFFLIAFAFSIPPSVLFTAFAQTQCDNFLFAFRLWRHLNTNFYAFLVK